MLKIDRVKMVSYNVNGIGDKSKRREIFAYLKTLQVSIILLQETHSSKETEHLWSAEWGNKIYFSHGTTAARGTAILFYKKMKYEVNRTKTDENG